jgi:glycosyltransferase involved in cell wall biosynthesis
MSHDQKYGRQNAQLAIIIPAYKVKYFERALSSIAAQTCKNFRVYVGDDCSPWNLGEICAKFSGVLDLKYIRFADNLGQVSLVDQWERCIALSDEPWVWLFSDDDIMEPQCVEAFFETLKTDGTTYDLYRFNTLKIDANDRITKIHPPHPTEESPFEFAYHRFHGCRESFASEYIFSRSVFRERKGIVEFPIGWCSDDASWILFSEKTGIRTIKGPFVCWRKSGENLTSFSSRYQSQKLEAATKYIDWFNLWLENRMPIPKPFSVELFKKSEINWFINQLGFVAPYSISSLLKACSIPKQQRLGLNLRSHLFMANLVYFKGKLMKWLNRNGHHK